MQYLYPRPLTGWQPLFTRSVEVTFRASCGETYSENTKRIKMGEELEMYFPEITDEKVKVAFLPADEHGGDRIVARSMFFQPACIDVDEKLKSVWMFLIEDRCYDLGGGYSTRKIGDLVREQPNLYNGYYGGGSNWVQNFGTTTDISVSPYGLAGTTNTVHYDNCTTNFNGY